MRSSETRASPWTIRRRLPSGSLNILWMWVTVPTGYRSSCIGSSSAASRCVKTPIRRPAALASSTRRTEASRATASGMKELGKRTVSRSGRTGSSGGIWSGRSGSSVDAPAGRSSPVSLIRSAAYPIPGSALHVDEQRCRTPALRHQAVALELHLASLLAVLAANREGQRPQSLLVDLVAALEAVAVGALFEPA